MKKAHKNAIYCSKTTQNEIIDTLGGMISETIVNEIKDALFFLLQQMKYKTYLVLNKLRYIKRMNPEENGEFVIQETLVGFKELC